MHLKLTLFWLALCLIGCSPPHRLSIRNDSPITISNVVICGRGYSNYVASLAPQQQVKAWVRPQAGSEMTLTFSARGSSISFSSGYRDFVRITPTLQVMLADRDQTLIEQLDPKDLIR